jgi:hypothetical protein
MKRASMGQAFWLLVSVLMMQVTLAGSANAEWKIESEDGSTSIKFGFLAQMRGESLDQIDGETTRQDLYFRRLRILFGGKISEKWGFFFETDSPNLGKGTADGNKDAGDIFIQDFFFTYNHSNAFKIDFGAILIPLSHNSQQSAASLLPTDYGPYSFLNSGPTDSRVGRDYGVQFRGYLGGDHFEYRAGVYQGRRGENGDNDFRYVGRIVFYPFEADKGFYYTGTTLGQKQILALGAGIDHQEDYDAYSLDLFWDQPIGDLGGLTLQVGGTHYDGGDIFSELPEQDQLLVELGYYFANLKLQPMAAYYARDFESAERNDESQLLLGLGYYFKGHNRVLKFSYTDISTDNLPDRDQFILQLQIFMF